MQQNKLGGLFGKVRAGAQAAGQQASTMFKVGLVPLRHHISIDNPTLISGASQLGGIDGVG